MNLAQRIKWTYSKARVELLVAEIEYLKSTVNLLVSVLYTGKTIRSYRKQKASKVHVDDIELQRVKVQNAIVEQINATDSKAELQAKAEKEERAALQAGSHNPSQPISIARIQGSALSRDLVITQFRDSFESTVDVTEERGMVMQQSVDLLKELLSQRTTLAEQLDASTLNATKSPRTECQSRQGYQSRNSGKVKNLHHPLKQDHDSEAYLEDTGRDRARLAHESSCNSDPFKQLSSSGNI